MFSKNFFPKIQPRVRGFFHFCFLTGSAWLICKMEVYFVMTVGRWSCRSYFIHQSWQARTNFTSMENFHHCISTMKRDLVKVGFSQFYGFISKTEVEGRVSKTRRRRRKISPLFSSLRWIHKTCHISSWLQSSCCNINHLLLC